MRWVYLLHVRVIKEVINNLLMVMVGCMCVCAFVVSHDECLPYRDPGFIVSRNARNGLHAALR